MQELVQVESLAQVGVQLLLFTLGLEFSLQKLKAVRSVALIGVLHHLEKKRKNTPLGVIAGAPRGNLGGGGGFAPSTKHAQNFTYMLCIVFYFCS